MKTYDVRLRRQQDIKLIKKLIWAYFFLLIFEGALRKWVLPVASNALLVVRDPVVVTAYFLAWRSGLFPRNVFVSVIGVLGVLTLAVGLLTVPESPLIAFYGFRANFLQWPFIFLIGRVFTSRDVERVGYWILLLAVPMAVLMALQFLAPPQSFLNKGASEGTTQITSALGRLRPPGTFSYVTGPTLFYAVVVAFLLYSQFKKCYPTWLTLAAVVAILCASAVSGSRSMVASMAIVFVFGLSSSFVLRPVIAFRWLGSLLVLGIIAFFLRDLPFVQTGLLVFSARVEGAANAEGGAGGFLARALSSYVGFFPALYEAPILGHGLGMGTVVGLALLVDKSRFVWFEDEWTRHILESGPFLGLSFMLYRIAFAGWLGAVSFRYMARFDPLPFLLFSSCILLLLTGSIGQVTVQGFIVLVSGLCLAAARTPVKKPARAPDVSVSTAPELVVAQPDLSLSR